MLRTSRHLIFSALLIAGCGDDDTKTAVDTNQPQEVAPDTQVQAETTPDTQVQPETSTPDTEVAAEVEVTPEVNNECTPEEAGKGFVGSPCTRDCECQNVNGAPLFCYDGFYMSGFRFCTDYADRRNEFTDIQEGEGVDTLQFNSQCFPNVPTATRTRPLYQKICDNVTECKAISSAYTHCGTVSADFPWSPGGRGTYCPTPDGGGATLSLYNTCIIATTPPFDGSYIGR